MGKAGRSTRSPNKTAAPRSAASSPACARPGRQLNCRTSYSPRPPQVPAVPFHRKSPRGGQGEERTPEATELLPGAFPGAKPFACLLTALKSLSLPGGNDSFGNPAVIQVHMASSSWPKLQPLLHPVYLPTDDSPPSPLAAGTVPQPVHSPPPPKFILVAKSHSPPDPLSLKHSTTSEPTHTPSFLGLSFLGSCDPMPSCFISPIRDGWGVHSLGKDS